MGNYILFRFKGIVNVSLSGNSIQELHVRLNEFVSENRGFPIKVTNGFLLNIYLKSSNETMIISFGSVLNPFKCWITGNYNNFLSKLEEC